MKDKEVRGDARLRTVVQRAARAASAKFDHYRAVMAAALASRPQEETK